MTTIKELQDRYEYLVKQVDIKKLAVEKALKELEFLCQQINDTQNQLKALNDTNEIKDSTI